MSTHHDCAAHYIVLHAEGSDIPHQLEGVLCPCLPKVFCAVCDRELLALGQAEGRLHIDRPTQPPVHVYPGWQERIEEL